MLLESLGRANAERQNMPAVDYALEPRPTNAVEDEDDDEYENDLERSSPIRRSEL